MQLPCNSVGVCGSRCIYDRARTERANRSGSWLRRPQDDDCVVDLFEGLERVCGNAEDAGQHSGRKPAEGLTYADVVSGFRRTGVLDDHYRHVVRAPVLEVVEGTLGCEHDVIDMLVETLMVAIPVDDDPSLRHERGT
jgi:hypothetical protein